MPDSREVEEIVFRALDSLNAERGPDEQIERSVETALFGPGSRLDSLSLVSLIVDVETILTSECGLEISLSDDRALARPVSPYSSVAALRDYVLELTRGA